VPDGPAGGRGPGTLYVVATPIGNLEDITLRALRILGEVRAIACEDTRQTLKLLNRYGLKNRLISYFHPKEGRKIPVIMGILRAGGDVALVSDAGTPGLADPGFPLIREALREGVPVVPVPGPSAASCALSASGLPTHRFLFLGFPPPKKTGLRKLLQGVREERATLVLYLPLRRIGEFLGAVLDELGDRQIVVARELTKVHEEFIRGRTAELMGRLGEKVLKGEATVLIEGSG
jgi:16S rRNA (cytidine1402-2'-O)-methyltransferase